MRPVTERLSIVCLSMITVLAVAAGAAMTGGSAAARADDAPRVFMFVRDGSRALDLMLNEEVGVMVSMLEDAGYRVDLATASDQPLIGETANLTPTVTLAEVDVADYRGVVLPCMAPARGFTVPPEVDLIVAAAVARGLPIAASRGSVATLARAGGVADRRYAFAGPVDLGKRPEFSGGDFEGIGVVRDGTITTAGICPLAARELGEPDGTAELMRGFIASLSETG